MQMRAVDFISIYRLSGFAMYLRSTSFVMGLATLMMISTGCAAPLKELKEGLRPESKATATTLKFAPGVYEATLSGSRTAQLEVDSELAFKYIEDSTRNGLIRQVQRKGNLRFSSWRKANAGNVSLEWVSQNTIRVISPFSSTIGHGNNEGNLAYSSGPFLSGMPSHTFYMNRIAADE